MSKLNTMMSSKDRDNLEVYKGNLLSPDDCVRAVKGVSVIFHVAAGFEKTFAGCFVNSVVTTRNLLEATFDEKSFKRFVNVSSFAVYSNMKLKRREVLDETCEIETRFMDRADAYCFGKIKQDEIVMDYGKKYSIPYVIVRPGVVYGDGAYGALHSRVGIDTFGFFLHLGGSNILPLVYIDNCADAIVLAGIKKGVNGEVLNVVDDNTPTSRKFLRIYKKNVKPFRSIYIPFRIFYFFCTVWELYSKRSKGQLPPVFNRRKCAAEWKGNRYPNMKLKRVLGWHPRVSSQEGIRRHCDYFKKLENLNA